MEHLYHVSASPHIRSNVTTASLMRDVCIALLPASAFGVYRFGFQAFLVLLVSVTSCVVSEYVFFRLAKKDRTRYESSAIVTGLILGMNLPATVPLFIPLVGGIFAIIVVKELFGGLGQNFMNPALAARVFLLICFAGHVANYTIPSFAASDAASKAGHLFLNGAAGLDGISGATPLAVMKELSVTQAVTEHVSLFDMFFGFTGGVIGETSVLMILIGGIYMALRRVINLKIPLLYLGSFALFLLLFSGRGFDLPYLAAQLCGGGLMFGAFFMATDYVTSPVTPVGQVVFSLCLGVLTGIFRLYGNNPEGVSYAIIFCNLLVPLIEKVTMPVPFGERRSSRGK